MATFMSQGQLRRQNVRGRHPNAGESKPRRAGSEEGVRSTDSAKNARSTTASPADAPTQASRA